MSANVIKTLEWRQAPRLGARRRLIVGAVAGVLLVTGCANPHAELLKGLRSGRYRTVKPMDLSDGELFKAVDDKQAAAARKAVLAKTDKAEGALELDAETFRKHVLAGNLGLAVETYAPLEAAEGVTEAQGAFDTSLTAGVTRRNSEPLDTRGPDPSVPGSFKLTDGVGTTTNLYEVGVSQPLVTGGSVSLNSTTSDTDVDLPAAILAGSGVYSRGSTLLFSVSQPLLLRNCCTAVNTAGITAAKLTYAEADVGLVLRALQILVDAEGAYWGHYAAVRELTVRREQYKRAEEQVGRAEALVEAGVVPRLELSRARAGLTRRVESIILARTRSRATARSLKQLMNLADVPVDGNRELLLTSEPEPRPMEIDRPSIVKMALANRPELKQLDLALARDEVLIDFRENQLLPDLRLGLSYSLLGQGDDVTEAYGEDFRSADASDWTAQLTIDVPIQNRGAEARLRKARIARLRNQTTRKLVEQNVQKAVQDAVDELEQSWERIIAARQESEVSGELLQAELQQFQAGIRTSTEVMEASDFLGNARIREIQALASHEVAKIRLAAKVGTLLGKRDVEIPLPDGPVP